jgi:peroxiredoxin
MPSFKSAVVLSVLCSTAVCGCASKTGPGGASQEVVRRMADYYKHLKSFSVQSDLEIQAGFSGKEQKQKTETTIVFERPNRLAMRSNGALGVTIVSDGTTIYSTFGALKKYTKKKAPPDLGELEHDPTAAMSAGLTQRVLFQLLSDDPYNAIMTHDTTVTELEHANLNGQSARHLRFNQRILNWDAWIADGDKPLLLQVTVDMSQMAEQMGAKLPGGSSMKMSVTQQFKDWQVNLTPKPDAFAFTPPKGMKEVQSFFGGADEEEADDAFSPLVGHAAPPVELNQLDGQPFRLADHIGREVVLLDMWATWCGPCVAELPVLAEIAKEYKSRGVALFAVNQQEGKDTVLEFLKEHKLDVSILLDSDGEVGTAYGARALPTLALIDKKGVIQSVHVGFSPSLKTGLRKQLDQVLAGKNLAAEASSPRRLKETSADAALAPQRLESQWSLPGAYSDAAYDPESKTIFARQPDDGCDVVGLDGKVQKSLTFHARGDKLRLARLGGAGERTLVVFSHWGHSVIAVRASNGSVLWEEPNATGIDDVGAADLDGDGHDEVIIGYNGFAGLHVLGPNGAPRWKSTGIGNVWYVATGDLYGDKKREVISTSGTGKVHVFAANGKVLATHDAPFYANLVRVGRLSKGDATDTIVVVGMEQGGGLSMAALDGKGHAKWTLKLPEGADFATSMALCPTRPWAACGARGGRIVVVDCSTGRLLATARDRARDVEVTWATPGGDEPPLLVVADGHALTAYRITAGKGPSQP